MKIDNDRILPALNPGKNESVGRNVVAGQNGEAGRNGEAVRSGGSDRVDISISKEDITRLENAAAQPADERSLKISSLKEQVSNGTYRVDAELVAEKILEKLQGEPSSNKGEATVE